ncbi:MAG: metallophosphatase [Paludibacteraceae bacterium]|nr:metallophosphatase [Paludibacteraceae bacterium]
MKKVFFIYTLVLLIAACSQPDHLTILHTNDTHSQVEPKADNTGGYARRMGIIGEERKRDKDLLLLDAGDFCQGTPYFNYYHGRVEIEAMNRMGYDVVTLGNHEFDNGIDTLAEVLRNARFSVVCANYDFTGTALEKIVKPYTIIQRGGIKIGVFGLGCDPQGLIADKNFLPAQYRNPYPIAQQMADTLRRQDCDVVVCLSHLGTCGNTKDDVCDTALVARTSGIDVVIGGHSHKLYDNLRICNKDGKPIPVCQMGKSGAYLGKIVLHFESKNRK